MSSSSSSEIPILPPLEPRYHNIPAPVIHPPGSDPGSLSNPNPHRFQVSIDVDPCVVGLRREEIVAKRFDLTASEHAGVSLCEDTTMVSTASDHPTNSAVVAPQTVKDLVATKPESKITSVIGYNVCNVTCNSEMAFKKHMEGNMHLKPTCSSTINRETPSPVANDTLDQESDKKKKNQGLDITQKLLDSTAIEQEKPHQELEKKNQDFLKSLFVCDILEPGRDYPKLATVEMDESLFKNGVPDLTSGTQNRPTRSEKNPYTWCEICKVTCNRNAYKEHQSGKRHIKNLKKLDKIPNLPKAIIDPVTAPAADKQNLTKGEVVNPNKGNYYARCELCGVRATSREMFNEHVSGKKHQQKLKIYGKPRVPSPALVATTPLPEPMIEETKFVFSKSSKRKANESSADTKRQKMNELDEGCVLVICKGCNVVCNGLMAFKNHSCRL